MFPETLETERLELVHLSHDNFDAFDLYEFYSDGYSDTVAEEFEHLTQTLHRTVKETRDFLTDAEEKWDDAARANWAIYPGETEPRTGEFAGVASLIPLWEKRTARLGLWLRKPFWGRGYSGERAAALMTLAFDRLDLELVSAGYLAGNEKSKRAIEKYVERFGGQYDGVLRNWVPMDDEVRDLHRYTVTSGQWAENRPDDGAVVVRE